MDLAVQFPAGPYGSSPGPAVQLGTALEFSELWFGLRVGGGFVGLGRERGGLCRFGLRFGYGRGRSGKVVGEA